MALASSEVSSPLLCESELPYIRMKTEYRFTQVLSKPSAMAVKFLHCMITMISGMHENVLW